MFHKGNIPEPEYKDAGITAGPAWRSHHLQSGTLPHNYRSHPFICRGISNPEPGTGQKPDPRSMITRLLWGVKVWVEKKILCLPSLFFHPYTQR
jgi:hypothetical protein